ncbi:beta strand repeat-containing protein, partial [Cysteiniphilum sp. SYW-8]|uniref:beta strand repeat-containing protein n=1 Tax=Cysteiniphilum sp. SYW-8 TaxID=2610890 RepID=UPI001CD0B218
TNIESASVTISNNYVNGEDILAFVNTANITGSFNAGTGVLTLTGSDTVANYQAALRSVTYQNTSDNPSTLARTVSFVVNDGDVNSSAVTSTINMTAVNDAAVVTAGAVLSYTENDSATVIDNTIAISDVDDTNLESATIAISNNYVNGQDVLAFVNTANITGSFNAGTGMLTLTGSDTVANYQAALRSVTYQNTSDNPNTLARTITFVVNDGDVNSSAVTSTINITAVNDAPVMVAGGTLNYTENAPASVIDAGISINDVDDTHIQSASVSMIGNYVNGEDILAFISTANITGSFNAASGVLTLSGSDTLANYQAALRSVTYQNTSDNPSTLSRTVRWLVNDGDANSNLATSTINVTAVNDVPVLSAGGVLSYSENDPATVIDNTIAINDVDDTNLESATITISNNYVNSEDILAFADTANITGSFNAGTGVLTLTGSDTVANYQAALRSVTYQNTLDNPSTLARTVSFVVNDGDANSTPVTSTINITAVNDAPVVVAGGTLSYTENDSATVIDNTIAISDVDDTNLESATITISNNYVNGEDVLAFINTANITGSFNAGTGVLTLTGSDTAANYQAALRSVTYQNTSDNPSTLARTVSFVVNDGDVNSSAVTSTINVTAVNDAAVVTAGAVLSYTENDAASVIDNTITINDVDDTNLESASVTISNNYVNGEDILAFVNTANITGSFNAGTGALTLTGSDTVANYQAALRSVTYQNTSDNPSTLARTVSFVVNDGDVNSTPVTSTINITAVNDAAVVTAGAVLSYTENDSATVIDNTIAISDVDDTNLESATITISNNYVNGEDVLAFVNTANITGSFNATTGVLTLTGTDTLANYQAALHSVTYQNTSDNPSTLARTVSFVVNDGDVNSSAVTSTINVTAVNDAAVVTAGAVLSYTENDAASVIDNTIAISDVDDTNLESATITISNNYVNGEDVLAFVNTANITGSFNATTGVLTLTGTDTLANYQAALRSVTYQNTSDNPSTLARTVSFVVNDGDVNSTPVTSTINITAVNDAPVVVAGGTLSYTENASASVIDVALTVNDADDTNIESASVTISNNYVNGEDILAFANTANITGSFNAGTGVLTLTGSDTLANYQAALRSVTYQNTSDNPSTLARTVSFVVNDGDVNSSAVTSTINITAVNDAPVMVAGGTLNYTENAPASVIDTGISINDVDDTHIQSASVSMIGNYVNGEDILAFANTANITGSFNAASGVLTLSGSDTIANYQAALRSVTYQNTSDNPSTLSRTVRWLVNDGDANSNLVTSTINVTAVNDVPVF